MSLLLLGCILSLSVPRGAPAASTRCAPGFTLMGQLESALFSANVTVCEDLRPLRGSVVFQAANGSVLASLGKSAEPLFVDESQCYLGIRKETALGSKADLLGNSLLARTRAGGGRDLTLAEVAAVVPPLVVTEGCHTFVGSRSSSVAAVFGPFSGDVINFGYPTMDQSAKFRNLMIAVFHDKLNLTATHEGLWGGFLPAVSFYFERASAAGWIEWTAVPAADMGGSKEQDVWFRVLRRNADGEVDDARYFDT